MLYSILIAGGFGMMFLLLSMLRTLIMESGGFK